MNADTKGKHRNKIDSLVSIILCINEVYRIFHSKTWKIYVNGLLFILYMKVPRYISVERL